MRQGRFDGFPHIPVLAPESALIAGLINAAPENIAIVPSTMEGESLIVTSLGLDKTGYRRPSITT